MRRTRMDADRTKAFWDAVWQSPYVKEMRVDCLTNPPTPQMPINWMEQKMSDLIYREDAKDFARHAYANSLNVIDYLDEVPAAECPANFAIKEQPYDA